MLDMTQSVGYNGLVDHSGDIRVFSVQLAWLGINGAGTADVVTFIRWALLILGSYQSGQMGLTVNQLSDDFGGSNPSLPI